MKSIILFDGVCNLCNGFVRFVIERDPKKKFKFGSLQSKKGKVLLRKHKLPLEMKTIVLIEGKKAYTESGAVLRICKSLKQPWPVSYGFICVPKFIRDPAYHFVSKRRYRWFGKKKACPLPKPEWKDRFL